MIRRPPRSTLFPTRRSSDLHQVGEKMKGLAAQRRAHQVVQPDLFLQSPNLFEEIGLNYLMCAPLSRETLDRKSTRLNSSHQIISYAVVCLNKKKRPST